MVDCLGSGNSFPPEAVWFTAPRTVEIAPCARAALAVDEVRVQALASGISHGTEMLVYRGQVPAGTRLDLPTLAGSFAFPIKYGYASVGRIIEVGAEVQGLAVGDMIFAHHPHQTEYVVPATMAVPLPSTLDPLDGVFLANMETAVNVMLDANPRLGDRVVIFGQGVIGLLLTQLVRRAGAGLVVTVDPLPERRVVSHAVGADVAIPAGEEVIEAVRTLTGGVGADVVLEASGNASALAQALEVAAFQAPVVVCSWYGAKSVTIPLGGAFHRERLRLVSSQVGTVDPALEPRWNRARRIDLARSLLTELTLRPLITHRIPFPRAARAYDLIDRQPQACVQVVLTYGERDV